MRKKLKLITALCLTFLLTVSLWGCGSPSGSSETRKIVIAYQYGAAYTPFIIMQKQQLIEKYAPNVEIEWQVLNSGSAITEGLAAGSIDIAALGVPPAITGITQGAPYKIYTNISSQPHALTTNDPNIKSLADITSEDKIAAVNIGSTQHIMLAMLAEKELGDAHALDQNIVAMSNPDGMQALLSGAVSCHQTSSPYSILELEEEGIYLVSDMTAVYPFNSPFIVGVASQEVYEDTELYEAILKATNEAIDFVNENKEETAALVCEDLGLTKEETLEYLNAEGSDFSSQLHGLMDIVDFMGRAEFIKNTPSDISEIAYENEE